MKRKLLLLLISLILLLCTSCMSVLTSLVFLKNQPTIYATLANAEDSDAEILTNGGRASQLRTDEEIAMTVEPVAIDQYSTGSFIVTIANNSDYSYQFEDSDLRIYGRKGSEAEWQPVGTGVWDADIYFARNRNTKLVNSFVAAAIDSDNAASYIASGLEDVVYSAAETTLNAALSSDYRRIGYAMTRLSPAEVAANSRSMSWLSRSLLYSSYIPAQGTLSGAVYTKVSKYSDYKLSYTTDYGNELDFYFERTDKEAMQSYWSDRMRRRISIVNGYAPFTDNLSIKFVVTQPENIGFYFGFGGKNAFRGNKYDSISTYSIKDKLAKEAGVNSSLVTDYTQLTSKAVSLSALTISDGITYQVLPHTWLMAGIEYTFGFSAIYERTYSYIVDGVTKTSGPLYVKDSGIVYIAPQIGADFIFGQFSFYALGMCHIGLKDFADIRLDIELGMGVSF